MDRKEAYRQKLLDPRWQKKRLQILERDQWTCQSCDSTDRTLHVHHRVYRGDDPWAAPDWALVTLCADCHEIETSMRAEAEAMMLKVLRRACFVGDLIEIGQALKSGDLMEWMRSRDR